MLFIYVSFHLFMLNLYLLPYVLDIVQLIYYMYFTIHICFQFTHLSCDDWENIYIYILCLIIVIKSEVWTITHYLGLGRGTMVSFVCLYYFDNVHTLIGD